MYTLEELRQKYPIGKTYIGSYYMDEVFYPDRILNDEEYTTAALTDYDDSCIQFMVYDEFHKRFYHYMFSYYKACGYYINANEVGLETYTDDYGYEHYDLDSQSDFFFITDLAAVVPEFDKEAYVKGYVFTDYNKVKEFIYDKKLM